jgi:catechol 2,3-dioxygenase-like lactoylglutathione lyase family enzyme
VIDHIGVNVSDLVASKAYYDALMPLFGLEPFVTGPDQFSYRAAGGKPGTYIFFYPSLEEGTYSRHRTGLQHLCFYVRSREQVHAVHAKVMELGSEVLHPPRLFPQYHENYFATFWRDPDGFMLEAVCHRPG